MKMTRILKFVLFGIILTLSYCWNNTVDAWKDGKFILNWDINNSTQEITFNLDVATKGWVSIALSKDGMMKDADMIMGYIDFSGKPVMTDRYATGRTLPPLDTDLGGTSDLKNIQGFYKNNRTNITFSRKLITGDKYDYNITQGQKIVVQFAIRDQGNPSTENGLWETHSKYSVMPIILWPLAGTWQTLSSRNSTNIRRSIRYP
jgi:hypothetical protein